MVTQQTLRKIKSELKYTFSTFSSSDSIAGFIEKEMKKRYLTYGLYTDERCSMIYKTAIDFLEKEVNNKYNKIAAQINEYIDGLNKYFKTNATYGSSNVDTLKHITIGAGAGLGAAIILGGPIAWMIGIGAGLAAIYNSNEKKKELIKKILESAEKINGEAIKKISEILDVYIINESFFTPPQKIIDADFESIEEEKLTDEQKQIKDFLNSRGIKYLVHFTDESNVESILKNGICSSMEAAKRGIKIKINDNNLNAGIANQYMKSSSHDYISLSITNINWRLLTKYKERGCIKKEKRILIDASILWKETKADVIYCNMNASSKSLSCGKDINALKAMFADYVSQINFDGVEITADRIGKDDNVPTHDQAEILFQSHIDPKYFVNIDELKNKDSEDSLYDLPF